MSVKIGLCGLLKSQNLGERFIARSLEYLIADEYEKLGAGDSLEFVEIDLLGRSDETKKNGLGKIGKRLSYFRGYRIIGIPLEALYKSLKNPADRIRSPKVRNLLQRFRHFLWKNSINCGRRLKKFYSEKLEQVSFVVVDGAGLLEYSFNEYHEPLCLLSECAEEKGRVIVYNAIGQSGKIEDSDFRCGILKKALQSETVRYISARDSVETVQLCAGENKRVKLLADAAFWMKEAYALPEEERSGKIGIGLVRGTAIQSYGVSFGSEDWIRLFSGIAEELSRRGYDYEFFTNGYSLDMEIGREVLKRMHLPESCLVPRPKEDSELYRTIRGYRGIITCRMHSVIAAFTPEVPAVVLSWNDKVNKLMDEAGYPERSVNVDRFNPEYIVDLFERALAEGVSREKVERMKEKASGSVKDYICLLTDIVPTD